MKIYKKILKIGLPVAFEQVIYFAINFVDTIMVGKNIPLLGLGALAISGIGIANNLYYIYAVSLYGLLTGASVFAAQYFGNKEYDNLKKLGLFMTTLTTIISFIFVVIVYINMEKVFSFYTNDKTTILLAVKYFRIAIFTLPISGIVNILSMQFRAINLPKYTLYSSIVTLFFNSTLNYILIFGKFKAPALGVEGAAIATLIARISNLVYLIYIINKKKLPVITGFRKIFTIKLSFIISILALSFPTLVQELLWSIAKNLKTAIFANISSEGFSSIQLAITISGLMFAFYTGVTTACAVLIGNALGNKNYANAENIAKKGIKMMFLISITSSVLYNLISRPLLVILDQPIQFRAFTYKIIAIESVFMIFQAFSFLFIIGILRAGADIVIPAIIDLAPLWLISLPCAFIAWKVFNMPLEIVYLLTGIDEIIKLIPSIYRYSKKKWIKTVI